MSGNHQVKQDRPADDRGAGAYPVASLTRSDLIYLYQASLMVPGLHFQVLKGSEQAINQSINAVGSGSNDPGIGQIDPYDANYDVSSTVTPGFKAVVDAAVAASTNRKGHIIGHPGLSDAQVAQRDAQKAADQAQRQAEHPNQHPPKHK
jgi:hypothetical protein